MTTWSIRTIRRHYTDQPAPEWNHLQISSDGLPKANEDVEVTVQADGSLLFLDVDSGVHRMVVDKPL